MAQCKRTKISMFHDTEYEWLAPRAWSNSTKSHAFYGDETISLCGRATRVLSDRDLGDAIPKNCCRQCVRSVVSVENY